MYVGPLAGLLSSYNPEINPRSLEKTYLGCFVKWATGDAFPRPIPDYGHATSESAASHKGGCNVD